MGLAETVEKVFGIKGQQALIVDCNEFILEPLLLLQSAFLEGTCACSEIRYMKSNNLMGQKTLKFVTVRTKGILRNGNVPLFFEIELFFTNIWEG